MKRFFAGLLILIFVLALGMNFAYAGSTQPGKIYGKNNGTAWERVNPAKTKIVPKSEAETEAQGAKTLYNQRERMAAPFDFLR